VEVEVEGGARLHVDEHGDGAGPLVLMLHGALASGRAFRGQVPALRDGYRVALPDLRGHGRSTPYRAGERLDGGVATRDVLALLEALSPRESAHVVGVSMGGILAARACALAPERFRTLALWSAPPGPDERWAAFFASTPPEALDPATRRMAALWHGEPYWRQLARTLFAYFASPAEAFEGRPAPRRGALVVQAVDDEMLRPDDPERWRQRIHGEVVVERTRGGHAFFADGRDGTRFANRSLRQFLDAR
jgi:pimeloyl-ACP methyl ester carboxylesterase